MTHIDRTPIGNIIDEYIADLIRTYQIVVNHRDYDYFCRPNFIFHIVKEPVYDPGYAIIWTRQQRIRHWTDSGCNVIFELPNRVIELGIQTPEFRSGDSRFVSINPTIDLWNYDEDGRSDHVPILYAGHPKYSRMKYSYVGKAARSDNNSQHKLDVADPNMLGRVDEIIEDYLKICCKSAIQLATLQRHEGACCYNIDVA